MTLTDASSRRADIGEPGRANIGKAAPGAYQAMVNLDKEVRGYSTSCRPARVGSR